MENNSEQRLDSFARKQLKELELDSPSKGFTDAIMNSISALENRSTYAYKPLISKKVWFIAVAAIVAIVFIPFQKKEGGLLEKTAIDFSFFDKISLPSFDLFSNVSVSTTTFYVFLLFAIMIAVQVFYIKGYFNKRVSGL